MPKIKDAYQFLGNPLVHSNFYLVEGIAWWKMLLKRPLSDGKIWCNHSTFHKLVRVLCRYFSISYALLTSIRNGIRYGVWGNDQIRQKNWEKHTILYGIFMSVGVVGVSVGVVGASAMLVWCRCDVSAMLIRDLREGVPSKNLAQIQSK